MTQPSTCLECGAADPPVAGVCPGCGALLALQGRPDAFTTRPTDHASRETASGQPPEVAAAGPAEQGRLVVSVGDARLELTDGECCLLGRSREAGMSSVFRRYPDVGAAHAEVRAARGLAEVTDQSSRHGTFVAGQRLLPHQPTAVRLPAVIRLASNCYVALAADESPANAARRGVPA